MIERYENYSEMHENVKKAITCIISNPCNNLKDEIVKIKNQIDGITLSNWKDSSSVEFRICKNECSLKLGTIITSISNVFKYSEKIYDLLNKQLDNFKIVDDNYENVLKEKPKPSDYQKTVVEDGISKTVNDTSAYESAHNDWQNVMTELETAMETCIIKLKEYIKELETIDGLSITMSASLPYITETASDVYVPTIIEYKKNEVIDRNYQYFIIEGTKIDAAGAEALIRKLGASNVSVAYYEASGKIGIRYNQSSSSVWNSKDNRVDGVKVHESGCGLLALAGVISSVLSNQNGTITYVTPTQLATDLSNYSKTNGGSGLTEYITNSSGLTGDYTDLGKAVSEIYGVSVIVNQKGGLSYNNYENIMDSGTSVMYSCANQRHINSAYETLGNNKVYECDTGSGKAKYLSSGTTYDPSKRAIYVSSSFGVENGYLTRNGEIVTSDIGNVNKIIISDKTYSLERTSDGTYQATDILEATSKYIESLRK